MNDFYKANDKYRVTVKLDQFGFDCEPELFTAFVSASGSFTRGLCSQYSDKAEIRAEEGLQAAIENWGTPMDGDWFKVVKYMRAFFGAELFYFYSSGARGWYVGTDEGQVDEYEAWCDGEVYSLYLEEQVHRTAVATTAHADGTVTRSENAGAEWDIIESVHGFVGLKFAEEAADDMFAPYEEK